MYRSIYLIALTTFAIFFSLPTAMLATCRACQEAAKKETQQLDSPDGWELDERFLSLEQEAYRTDSDGLFAIVDRVPAPKGDHKEWFKEHIEGELSKYTDTKIQGPVQLNDDAKRPVKDGYLAFTVSKNQKGQKVVATFAVLISNEAQVWKIFWNNADDVEKNSELIAKACNFLADGGRKAPLPKGSKDLNKLLSQLRGKDSKTGDAKTKSSKTKSSKTEDEAKPLEPKPYVAKPGQGVTADQLRGVVYDFGKRSRKKIWVNDMPMLIPKWSGAGVYLVFKDGWAYRSPSVPPADLDVAASRRVEPKKWKRWDDVKKHAPTQMMSPLAKGTRIDISVQRPNTSSSSRYSVRTSWRNLKLTSDGRFETGSTSISSKQTGIDSSLGPSSNAVSSSDKDGSFSSVSGSYVAGGGMMKTTSAHRQPGSKGNHSGTYLIDGNTIELRYDNGAITRAVFGFDGEREIIFGGTNYWVPKASK